MNVSLTGGSSRADSIFGWLTKLAAGTVLGLLVAIFIFLAVKAAPSLHQAGFGFFTTSAWFPDAAHPHFGVAALAWGTFLTSVLALLMATPIALGAALALTELVPPRLSRPIGYLIDLLAAVPSVVYGLWGVAYLVPHLIGLERNIDSKAGSIPVLHSPGHLYGRSVFAASVVLAIMVLPIIAAISREVFRQVPTELREASLALGATRWEMIRMSVLPPSRSGMVGAIMLGLGRALGETIAVALVLASTYKISIHIFAPGGNTIAANIATKFGEAGAGGRSALIASGLVLFLVSIAVNLVARLIVRRSNRPRLATR